MKPTKLVMSAFGSYVRQTQIDMSLLGEKGLYLITGDTGAGKTTIFDAIAFALYGEPSGESRETKMLRNNNAGAIPTFVELTFTYGGKEYSVRRNPEYARPKERGAGETKQKAEATLTYPDGHIETGYNAVTRAVTELIGLDKQQYTRIAMIAQGEFMKLLTASTADRIKIFRRIFNTENYERLQERLKSSANAAYREYRAVCERAAYCLAAADIEFDKTVNTVIVGEAAERIDMVLAEDKVRLKDLKKDIAEAENTARELDRSLGEAAARAECEKEAERLSAYIAEHEPKLEALKSELEAASSRQQDEKRQECAARISVIRANMKKYDSLLELRNSLSRVGAEAEKVEEKLNSMREKISVLKTEISAYDTELEGLKDVQAELGELKSRKERLKSREDEATRLKAELIGCAEAAEKAHILKQSYAAAAKTMEEESDSFTQINRRYLDIGAGIMAAKLRDGCPCPVCGSTTHPKPAKLSGGEVTEADVKAAEKRFSQARKRAQEASATAHSAVARAQTLQSAADEAARRLFGEGFGEVHRLLEDELGRLQSEKAETEKRIELALYRIERKKLIEKRLPEITADCQGMSEELVALEKKNAQLGESKRALRLSAENLAVELEYPSKEKAEAAAKELRDEISAIDARKTAAKERLEAEIEKINDARSRCAALEAQLGGECVADISDIRTAFDKNMERLNAFKAYREAVLIRQDKNRRAASELKRLASELEERTKSYVTLKSLSDTANGELSGKEKIRLEAYVQQAYFGRVLARANTRFMAMTGGRYELELSNGAENLSSKSGLDIEVRDHYTAGIRSTKSLSGGESFLASLALALGMSDEVQSSAGGVRLESMFVDEGFGALDDEALDKAVEALGSLTQGNRMVGIISHVSRLKEKIDRRIQVSKNQNGESSALIFA